MGVPCKRFAEAPPIFVITTNTNNMVNNLEEAKALFVKEMAFIENERPVGESVFGKLDRLKWKTGAVIRMNDLYMNIAKDSAMTDDELILFRPFCIEKIREFQGIFF